MKTILVYHKTPLIVAGIDQTFNEKYRVLEVHSTDELIECAIGMPAVKAAIVDPYGIFDFLAEITQHIPVVVLASDVNDVLATKCMSVGVRLTLHTNIKPNDLRSALNFASSEFGRTTAEWQWRINRAILQDLTEFSGWVTPTILRIIKVMPHGLSNKEIADYLDMPANTVRNNISAAMSNLGLSNRTQLAIWAYRHGLVDTNYQEVDYDA